MKKKPRQRMTRGLIALAVVAVLLWLALTPAHHHARRPGAGVQVPVVSTQLLPPPETSSPTTTIGSTGSGAGKTGQGDEKAEPSPAVTAPAPHPYVPPPAKSGGHPRIAIVIDDVGLDLRDSQRAVGLPAFITLSYMPYATRLREQTRSAREMGHELMLHMPMEPMGGNDPGPGALLTGLSPDELRQRFETALASFTGFDGVNNHMGSKFTADPAGMQMVMGELQPRHLFFLDSRTSAQTLGYTTARAAGVPSISRDVFLDDDMRPAAVMKQLEQTEAVARRKGYAVAIGHPHPATLDALRAWIPQAEIRGFDFVPVHDLIGPPL